MKGCGMLRRIVPFGFALSGFDVTWWRTSVVAPEAGASAQRSAAASAPSTGTRREGLARKGKRASSWEPRHGSWHPGAVRRRPEARIIAEERVEVRRAACDSIGGGRGEA